jgi:GMP synthase-like glutamine amidotransferase
LRALAITYETNAGPGVFADAFASRGMELDTWLRTRDAAPPRPVPDYDAVLCLGGAMHVDQRDHHPWLDEDKALLAELIEAGTPLLCVCLGAQLMTLAAGGEVHRMPEPEIGWRAIEVAGSVSDPLLGPAAPRFEGLEWHSYECTLPPGAVELARNDACLQAFRAGESAWAIQFHAEVTLEDAESWLDDYASDPDAVRINLDPEALREETRAKIGAWNELGRELCGRFLDAAG